jgi:hypothetical protein
MARGLGVWLREDVWEIPLRRYLAILLATALVAGLVVGVRALTREDRSCAPGVVRPEGSTECVGVSATAYDFGRERLAKVIAAIDRENRSLEPGSYVTVALLEPFTAKEDNTITDVLHEVQGAYLAQYRANHQTHEAGPAIRLVLANPGATGAHWKYTVDRLAEMAKGPDKLRAVTGVSVSSEGNKLAVTELTRRGIPVIGSSITADDIANGQRGREPFPGLARVAPTNTDLANALKHFADIPAKRAMLVHAKPGDPYTRTLQRSFARIVEGSPYEPKPFSPPRDHNKEGSTANTFEQITDILCDTPDTTDTILFAGRHVQLRQFINALGARGCTDRRFTVLAGDEGSYLTGDRKLDRDALTRQGSKQPVVVRYTALAHPKAWYEDERTGWNPPATGGSVDDIERLRMLMKGATPAHEQGERNTFGGVTDITAIPDIGEIGDTALDDGQLIIAYDAMALAVRGIRGAGGGGVPSLGQVRNQWPQVQGDEQRVDGASGWICLNSSGNPVNKAVPIVELTPEGRTRFVRIAWPEKEAPTECIS